MNSTGAVSENDVTNIREKDTSKKLHVFQEVDATSFLAICETTSYHSASRAGMGVGRV